MPYSDEYLKVEYNNSDERGTLQPCDLTTSGIRNGDSGLAWRGYIHLRKTEGSVQPGRALTTVPVDGTRSDHRATSFATSPTKGGPIRSTRRSASTHTPTEFRLAELLEADTNIKAWTRIDNHVPLRIAYGDGTQHREYMPDILVISTDDVHWIIEGKADNEMATEVGQVPGKQTRSPTSRSPSDQGVRRALCLFDGHPDRAWPPG